MSGESRGVACADAIKFSFAPKFKQFVCVCGFFRHAIDLAANTYQITYNTLNGIIGATVCSGDSRTTVHILRGAKKKMFNI